MPLMPRRIKHRKTHRGRIRGMATRGTTVEFGEFGIQSLEPGWITARQIEAARVAITHFLAREGKVWLRVFPDKSISGKPAETRMGKGKGEPAYWVAVVRPGTVLYEVGGVPPEMAKEALNRAAHKLPFRVRLATRRRTL